MGTASNNIKELVLTKEIDFANDDFKIILMKPGFTFNRLTHNEYADVAASEVDSGNGYITGGETLSGVSIDRDDVLHIVTVNWNPVTWLASGGNIGPAIGAIIYDDTVTDDPIVGYVPFGQNYTQIDGGAATLHNISARIR